MAPKSKSKKAGKGKGKSPAVVDGHSTEEMSKDQLEQHIVRLREELEREREERSYFQLETNKIQGLWEVSRVELEREKDKLRVGQREREEAEERHRVEISVYKQKLKHVLSEQHQNVSELKMDAAAAASLLQRQNTESELGLRTDTQGLQADGREKRLRDDNCIEELTLKHQVELMELTNDFDRRVRGLEVKHHKKMQVMMEAEGRKRRSEVNELEDRMNRRVASLMEEHARALRGAEEYHCGVQSKILTDQKVLEEEAAEVQKQLLRADHQLSVAQQENRRLRESLQENQQKLPELRLQLQDYNRARAQMVTSRARVKVVEEELRDLTVEHELLLQAFEKVQQERDELLRRQMDAILDLQQKSGLKELLLERKLAALTQTVEKKEAQLCAVLSTAADQEAGCSAANKLQEILVSKQNTIGSLQQDLARECQEYDQLLTTCAERLSARGVPLYDFPFRTSQQILNAPPAKN
ncbi:putative growth arrest-specific protein 8-like [Scophthalmus maximus]|uniref:Dynein regulatory complex subunit 4 n=1 Tax=Scophthalmus maximus TaxID=52904 RepID=A0A2U9BLX9_SCOMX|nr:putative growth arrest-specific protein 8-like [Scophthalmus maximus]